MAQAASSDITIPTHESKTIDGRGRSTVTRRLAMNMFVSAGAIAAATLPAQALTANPDQELIDLAKKLMDQLPAYKAADARCNLLWDEFEARKPELNPVLRWSPMDCVGYTIKTTVDGKRSLWCDPFDISVVREMRQYDWSLPDSNEAEFFALPEDDQLRHHGAPKPSVQHLFSKKPSRRKQNRINKLAAALDEHTAACDALKAELGCDEAADTLTNIIEPIAAIAKRMNEIKPTTAAGLQARATALFYWYWNGEEDYNEDPLAVEIIKGLVNLRLAA